MELLILNGSPRAPISNSKEYIQIFLKYFIGQTKYIDIKNNNIENTIQEIQSHNNILLTCPLYVDNIPVHVLDLFKMLEKNKNFKLKIYI